MTHSELCLATARRFVDKVARRKYHTRLYSDWDGNTDDIKDPKVKREWIRIKNFYPELFYIQAPHLGSKRYYVCEWGLLKPDEIPESWGLYWYRSGKFYRKKDSKNFRVNMRDERDLMVHEIRRYASGDHTGILVNTY